MNILSGIGHSLKRGFRSKKPPVKHEVFEMPNKHKALLVFPTANDEAKEVIKTLDIPSYKAVFLNLGTAENFDEKLQPRLIQLFSRGISNAAINANAIIIDGGLPSGVMELMGKGVADREYKSTLIGMAPAYKVTFEDDKVSMVALETNHSHFVLTEGGRWETEPIVNDIISQLINRPVTSGKKKTINKVPALAILTGGNESTKSLLLQAVRLMVTVIIIEGSGGLADELAVTLRKNETPEDPVMSEILSDGKFFFNSLDSPINEIQKLIAKELGVDKVLMQAWETFADYDFNSVRQEKKFDILQQLIISIGILGTLLVVLKEVLVTADVSSMFLVKCLYYEKTFRLLTIIPILLTVLITITNRFKQGNKWLLLRAAAESIKIEIFRYRTRTNEYVSNAELQLTKKIQEITTRIMRTEVNSSYLAPYDKTKGFPPVVYAAESADDGFSNLTANQYIDIRVSDQLNYFRKRSVRLGKQLTFFLYMTFIVGGIGTYLAAVDQTMWIALTTAIVVAIGTYLGYRQTENTLTNYNQTATNLSNIKAWWNALSPTDQVLQENINTLVDHTEQVLQVDLNGWIQQMQNALAELRKNQEQKTDKKEPEEK